jgi:hypothetical protein
MGQMARKEVDKAVTGGEETRGVRGLIKRATEVIE